MTDDVKVTMKDNDMTCKIRYTLNSYNVTVKYHDKNEINVHDPITKKAEYTSKITIKSPEVKGYTAQKESVTVTVPAEDSALVVYYDLNSYEVKPIVAAECQGQGTVSRETKNPIYYKDK